MIEGIELCKRFGEKELFNNLSFQIDDGEFICFSGESGKDKGAVSNMDKITKRKKTLVVAVTVLFVFLVYNVVWLMPRR